MKNKIKNYLLRHLLNAIVLDDVITQDKAKKYILVVN